MATSSFHGRRPKFYHQLCHVVITSPCEACGGDHIESVCHDIKESQRSLAWRQGKSKTTDYIQQTKLSSTDEEKISMISEIGGALSIVCCVMTLTLLCLLPIRSDGLFITGNMCIVLMAAQLSFIGSENTGYPNPIMCKIATCVLHYFFMCVHFSSLAYAIHLWTKFGPQSGQACRKKGVYLSIIWLVPGVIVLLTAFIRGDQYAKETRCWLPLQFNTRLAFLVPVFLIQLVNWVLFVIIIRAGFVLDKTKGRKKRTLIRHMCLSSLSMFPIFGLQWTIGYAVTFDLAKVLQYTFVVLASGQGMLLLVFHVLTNGQIQKALCTKIAEKESDESTTGSDRKTVDSQVEMSSANKKD